MILPHRALRAGLLAWALSAAAGCGEKINPGGAGTDDTDSSGSSGGGTSTGGCVAAAVTYASAAATVVQNKCLACHASGGSVPDMSTYDKAKAAFVSGGAQDAVDNGSMPMGSVLSAADKCTLTNWKSNAYAP